MLQKESVKALDVQTASLQSYIRSSEKELYKGTLLCKYFTNFWW
jgi:hypothetical protein